MSDSEHRTCNAHQYQSFIEIVVPLARVIRTASAPSNIYIYIYVYIQKLCVYGKASATSRASYQDGFPYIPLFKVYSEKISLRC